MSQLRSLGTNWRPWRDTLANVLGRYTARPEHKSLAPDSRPAGTRTASQLQRRLLTGHPADTVLTGKEGNKLAERLNGQTTDPADHRNDYGTRADPWTTLIHPVLKDRGAAAIIKHGIPPSTAYNALAGATPRRETGARLQAAVVDYASAALAEWDRPLSESGPAVLAAYLRERNRRGENIRRCQWCGRALPPEARADARYDKDAFRQAARRARLAT